MPKVAVNSIFSLTCDRCGPICTALAHPQEGWSRGFSVKVLRNAAETAKAAHEMKTGHSVVIATGEATGKTLAEEEKNANFGSVLPSRMQTG